MEQRFFGKFLVEREVISDEQLLDALIEQQSDLPTTAEIIKSLGLLNSVQIIDAMGIQFKEQISFLEACKALELWQPEWDDLIQTEVNHLRKPLGWILLKKFDIPVETIVQQLDEFMAPYYQQEDATPQNPRQETQDNIIDFAKSFDIFEDLEERGLDTDILPDYAELMSDDFKSELELEILSWEKVDISDKDNLLALNESFRSFYRHYHTVKGSVRFLGGVITERLVHKAEDLLSAVMNNLERIDTEIFSHFPQLNLDVVDLVWQLSSVMLEQENEWSIKDNQDFCSKLNSVYSNICNIHESLESQLGDTKVDLDAIADAF